MNACALRLPGKVKILRTVISIDLISLKIQIVGGNLIWFEPQIFEQNFPAQDLNFEGD